MINIIIKYRYFFLLIFINFLIFFDYIFLGPFSYIRIFDNIDTFLPRNYFFFNNNFSDWISSIQNGISANYSYNRKYYLPSYLLLIFDVKYLISSTFVLCNLLSCYYTFKIFKYLKIDSFYIFTGVCFYWTLMHFQDLIWYFVALSFIPMVFYFLFISFDNNINLIKRYFFVLLSSSIFIVTNHFLLTTVYVYIFLCFLSFVYFKIKSFKKKTILINLFIFTILIVLFNLINLIDFVNHAILTKRIDDLYYNYGLIGFINLLKTEIANYWPVLLLTTILLFFSKKYNEKHIILSFFLLLLFILLAQSYGFFLPILNLILGEYSNFPIQRFSMLMPVVSLFAIPFFLNILSLESEIILKYQSYKLSKGIGLFILIFCVYFNMNQKYINIFEWYNYNNFGWLNSKSWSQIESDKSLFRIALIANHEKKFIPGFAQIKGFETFGGDETTTKNFANLWKSIAKYKNEIPKHSFYFGFKEIDKFKTDPISDLLNIKLLEYSNVKYLLSSFKLELDNINDISYVIDNKNYIKKNISKLDHIFNGSNIYIYKLNNAKNRLFLTNSVLYSSDNYLMDNINKINSLKNEILINEKYKKSIENFLSKSTNCENSSEPKIQVYTPTNLSISLNSSQNCLLLISNSFHPGWKLKINGKESEIYLANLNHIMIPIKKGKNEILLIFSG